MKKLAIFDFDGTLCDTVMDVVICFDEALSSYGFPTLTRQEYIECLGGNIDEAVSLILKNQNSKENIELIKNAYEKLYSVSNKQNSVPFPDALEVLNKLQEKGILLAINSNRKTDSIKYFADKYFKSIDFVLIEGHNPDYPSKPNPFGVNRIIKKADVSLDETVYIGDSSTDINTAKNSGIDCILVSWGYGNEKDYENEYVLKVVEDMNQLLDIV